MKIVLVIVGFSVTVSSFKHCVGFAMNYAEDRLDRRSRHDTTTDVSSSASISPLELDLMQSHVLLKEGNHAKGHELAGRSLRDAGFVRQATFHYGMAWYACERNEVDEATCGENEGDLEIMLERAVGDYAQMTEFASFPEVGIVALLYHRAGGNLAEPDYSTKIQADEDHQMKGDQNSNDSMDEYNIFRKDSVSLDSNQNCGCGMKLCGASPCFVPHQMIASHKYQDILRSLDEMKENLLQRDETEITAAAILGLVSRATQKKNPISVTIQEPNHIPSVLQFWEESNYNSLSPLLQILLLKLLYSAPIGTPFLELACHGIHHLSLSLPTSSKEGRAFANSHKSHWAYYILIYKIVLGERVKKSRRGTRYHYPIWDIVHHLDQRKFSNSVNCEDHRYPGEMRADKGLTIARHLEKTIQSLSYQDEFSSRATLPRMNPACLTPSKKVIFALGDSHVLSLGWQTLQITTETGGELLRTIVPNPVTGLKAWHTRDATNFFTKYNLECCLQRLPPTCKTIILSAGEIDCREGIGGALLEGYSNECEVAVQNTVKEYVSAINIIATRYDLQILLLPVAPHAYRSEKNGRALGRGLRRQRMLIWNEVLRKLCGEQNTANKQRVFLLDYEESLRAQNDSSPVGFVLSPVYNADFTHMNSAFLPLLEEAIVKSNCNLDLL
uniref:SGNH hydrolase-type esterase domain-containing protein n=1 Tax=Chaetoceros debilis TaxID=122233 RepID=A0A6S8TGL9_9STRA